MLKIRFPRTWLGWTRLFWITIRKCPKCKGSLIYDNWYGAAGDTTLYCMPCGGAMYPGGFWRCLASNYRSVNKEKAKPEVVPSEAPMSMEEYHDRY